MTRKVFVSYAHADEPHLRVLTQNLQPLVHNGVMSLWSDHSIRPGDSWEGEIDTRLAEADVILLLVSVAFLNSSYCFTREMPMALERSRSRSALVIPILLEDCLWQSTPLATFQMLPAGPKPVLSEIVPSQAWTSVARDLQARLAQDDTASRRQIMGFLDRLLIEIAPTAGCDAGMRESRGFDAILVPPKVRVLLPSPDKEIPVMAAIDWLDARLGRPKPLAHCLIVADYGLGKSHLARHLFCQLRDKWIRDGGRVPVYFPLNLHNPSSYDPLRIRTDLLRHLQGKGFPVADRVELDSILEKGTLDLILDGFDEIPLVQIARDPAQTLQCLLQGIPHSCGCLLTSRKGILAPLFAQPWSLSGVDAAEIEPWAEHEWSLFVGECFRLNLFKSMQDFSRFLDKIKQVRSLQELTCRPIYGRMLVEASDAIIAGDQLDIAKLYGLYSTKVLSSRDQAALGIEQRIECLEGLAAFLCQNHQGFCTWDELRAFVVAYLKDCGAEELRVFLTRDLQTYSLLSVSHGDNQVLALRFSHKSFYEYFLARDALACLRRKDFRPVRGPQSTMRPSLAQLLEQGELEFLALLMAQEHNRGLLVEMKDLVCVHPPAPYPDVLTRRNISIAVGMATGSFDGCSLAQKTEFSGLRLERLSMRGCRLDGLQACGASLAGSDLEGSSLVRANLARCNLAGVNLRNANLRSASLMDLPRVQPPPLLAGAKMECIHVSKADLSYLCSAVCADPALAGNPLDAARLLESQAVLVDAPNPNTVKKGNPVSP